METGRVHGDHERVVGEVPVDGRGLGGGAGTEDVSS
jgi:hypothetical protein